MVCPLVYFPLHSLRQFSILPGFAVTAIRPTIGWLVIMKILVRLDHPSRLKAKDFQALGGGGVRGPSARGPRADHDHVINFLRCQTRSRVTLKLQSLIRWNTCGTASLFYPATSAHQSSDLLRL